MKTSDIAALPPRDQHHLLAAEGWLELGNHLEANAELEEITHTLRGHPFVLELRYGIYASAEKWEACVEIAGALIKLLPQDEFGWIHRSFALHEQGRTLEAFELLSPVVFDFPRVWTFPYNLACYCAQLDRLQESERWLKQAIAINTTEVQAAALDDPDLKPLWDSMSGTLWSRP